MPSAVNYSHPEKYGIRGTRNFYIKTEDNMTLGVWYVTSYLFCIIVYILYTKIIIYKCCTY